MCIGSKALLISSANINRCMFMAHVCFYVCCNDCVGVCGNVCCVAAIDVFCTRVVLVCLMLCDEVYTITEMRDMGLYEVPLSMSLLVFGMMGTMLANFHMCGMLLLRAF